MEDLNFSKGDQLCCPIANFFLWTRPRSGWSKYKLEVGLLPYCIEGGGKIVRRINDIGKDFQVCTISLPFCPWSWLFENT